MVANGKADVNMLNKYLSEYSDLIFGRLSKIKKTTSPKEELYEDMKGFRTLFKDKVTFKPKVGQKFDTEVKDVNLIDLIKSRNK